jgi:DNA/RNA-binding domain of Phe-tRNA-synthetase-like protein
MGRTGPGCRGWREDTSVYFAHDSAIWRDFPALVPGALFAEGITPRAEIDEIDERVARFTRRAAERLDGGMESEFPEIQAWRRAFAAMGLKPTPYRCASESLLRRFRKEGALPRLHPLVDICNAISLAYAIPVAVFDVANVSGHLRVRHASGDEDYLSFAGETEHPAAGEVVFADGAGQAHARRWTNRQSALSAVRDTTSAALIVAEALHPAAVTDVPNLLDAVAGAIGALWCVRPAPALLSPDSPRFSFSAELTSHGT